MTFKNEALTEFSAPAARQDDVELDAGEAEANQELALVRLATGCRFRGHAAVRCADPHGARHRVATIR